MFNLLQLTQFHLQLTQKYLSRIIKSMIANIENIITNVLFCVSCLLLITPAHATETKKDFSVLDRVVASVNSEAVPESELKQQMQLLLVRYKNNEQNLPPEDVLRKQLLDKIIMEKLQLQIAKQAKIEIDEPTLTQAVNQMASRDNMTVAELEQFLGEQGISFKQFKQTIKNEMTISKLQQREVAQFITISASELDHFINSPMGQDQTGAEYQLGHILIAVPEHATLTQAQNAENKAKDLVKQIKAGGNFKQLAMSHSAGPQALNGGELGWKKSPELPTLFSKIAPTLPVGGIYGPIKNSSGYHIIKLLDKRIEGASPDNKQLSNEVVKNKAMDILFQRKFEEQLTTWIRRLRDEAQIETYLNEG